MIYTDVRRRWLPAWVNALTASSVSPYNAEIAARRSAQYSSQRRTGGSGPGAHIAALGGHA